MGLLEGRPFLCLGFFDRNGARFPLTFFTFFSPLFFSQQYSGTLPSLSLQYLIYRQSSKMARGTFLGRSRTIRQAEAGSSPTSKHPDMLPRKDQKCIEDGANKGRPAPHVNRSFHRPGVSEGHQQKKMQAMSPINTEAPPLLSSPVSSPVSTDNDMNGSLIGVALGSPRMIDPQVPTSQMQETVPVKPAEPQTRPSLQRKPSKWKKIGGLFKAKAAMTTPPNQPFYQVRLENEWPMQGSTYSFDQQPKTQSSGHENPASPTSGTDAWPSLVPEIQTSTQEPQQSHADATSGSPPEKEQSLGSGPLLQVDIPDIQLERYSVMFGGVLKKNRLSAMSRRSKNLEDSNSPTEQVACLNFHSTSKNLLN